MPCGRIKLLAIMNSNTISTIDLYIESFPKPTQALLKLLREIIKKAAPQAEEVISYKMPAYKYHGMLVYFAGHPKHIGFYPGPAAIEAFKNEISNYKSAKGSVQFPLDKALPLHLISEIVKFKIEENLKRAKAKKK